MNPDVLAYPQKLCELDSVSTPFFVYDEKRIRSNCQRLQKAFQPLFAGFTPLYAIKANPNWHVLKIIQSEGFGFDCSSPLELYLANQLEAFGMYTGNYTPEAEFRQVLESPLVLLNLDDISMIPTVQTIKMPEFISFRINPGITAGGMKSLLFAGPDAKYGVPHEQAIEAYRQARQAGATRFGIHMMTGSNVLQEEYFALVTSKLLQIAGQVKQALGLDFEYINIGGVFGVPYQPQEPSLNLEKIATNLREVFDRECQKWHLAEPKLMIEPGRYLMADAGFLVTQVQVIKQSYTKFAGVDAGMNDLPRPATYDAYHHISVLSKSNSSATEKINIVGRLCENNDQFAKHRTLPVLSVGDRLVIHNASAHSYAMGHNYNGRPRSAEYILQTDDQLQQIRRDETIQDLLATITDF